MAKNTVSDATINVEFWGDLKPDGGSTELRFFDLDNLPENIMPTQIGYIKKFVENTNKC